MMKRGRSQQGSAILESLVGMCFLLFICFAFVELFFMIGRQMTLDYASFYGAKALSLGYAAEICRKAVRVAGIPASGKDISSEYQVKIPLSEDGYDCWRRNLRNDLRIQARRYMSLGRASGVEYQYWYNEGAGTRLQFSLDPTQDAVRCQVRLRKPEFLVEPMGRLMGIAEESSSKINSAEPYGEARMYNYSRQWMDE